MRRREAAIIFRALLLIVVSVSVSGCWDSRELVEFAFAGAVGIDRGSAPGLLRVTVLVPIPAALAGPGSAEGGAGGSSAQPVAISATAEGTAFFDANRILNRLTARTIDYTHTRILIIGEDLAREGLAPVIDLLHRNTDFRRSLLVAVADGTTAEEMLLSVRPDLARSPTDYLAGLVSSGFTFFGEVPLVRVHDLDLANVGPNLEIALPLLRLEPKPPFPVPPGAGAGGGGGQGAGGGQSGGGGGAGGGGEAAAPPPERRAAVSGTALFRNDRMVAKLDPVETMGFLLVQGRFRRGLVTVRGPETEETPVVFEVARDRSRCRVRRQGDEFSVEIAVRLAASIEDVAGPAQVVDATNYPALKALLEAELERRMTAAINKAKTEVGGDPFNLGLAARRTFRSWPEWANFDWHGAFREADVTVRAEITSIRPNLSFQAPVSHE